ncbi:CLUMA_CG002170, isoform A [Clunio marinus]|uniref:CLUMA_CG002170, isoform A n=1 Tax=Clunio marinus TaxID=568069 RepID=A0A1J1HQA5_9DIPT|nr:CLUMA_CG002170, isoform A [Clunio marinus]
MIKQEICFQGNDDESFIRENGFEDLRVVLNIKLHSGSVEFFIYVVLSRRDKNLKVFTTSFAMTHNKHVVTN